MIRVINVSHHSHFVWVCTGFRAGVMTITLPLHSWRKTNRSHDNKIISGLTQAFGL